MSSAHPQGYAEASILAGGRVAGAIFPACEPMATRSGIQVLQSMNVMDR